MKSFKIKEVFHSIRNGANIKQDKSSGGIPITRIETISESTIDLEKLGYAGITDDSFKNFYLQEGDILMSHINSVSHLGKVAIFENRSETIIHGMNLLCLKARTNILYPKYAYYFFRSPIFINSLKRITKKSVNQASFNISNFEHIDILIPEKYADQIRIATVLSKVETLIKQRKESIALLDEFLKSSFLKMFGDSEKFTRTPIKDIASKVKYSMSSGPFGSNLTSEHYTNEGVVILRGTNVTSGTLDLSKIKFVSEEKAKELERSEIKPNDIVIVAVGSSGKALRVPENLPRAIISQNFNKITPNLNIINPIYLEYSINSHFVQRQFERFMTDAGRTFLSLTNIKEILVPVPDLKLQRQFAGISEKTETLKTHYQNSLQELENLFASLSQKAFKGNLDLSRMELFFEEQGDKNPFEVFKYTEDKLGHQFHEEGEKLHILGSNIPVISKWVKAKVAGEKLATLLKETEKLQTMIGGLEPLHKLSKQYRTFEKLLSKIPDKKTLPDTIFKAQEAYENIRHFLPEKSIWEQTRIFGITLDSNLEFNEYEGNAILKVLFSKKAKGFTSQQFITTLKEQRFEFHYEQVRDFIFKKIEEKIIVQYYASEKWMKSAHKPHISPIQDDFVGNDGSIWFNLNKNIV